MGAIALWLAIGRERVASGLLLVAAAGPAILVGAWAFTRPALTEDDAIRSDRVADGTVFGVLALVGAAVVATVVAVALRRSLDHGAHRRVGRGLIALAAVLVIGVGAAVSVSAADALSSSRDCSEVVNDPSRLGTLDLNLRLCWWEEALDVYSHHGPEGAGAGTFEVARKRFRAGRARRRPAAQRPAAAPRGRRSSSGSGCSWRWCSLRLACASVRFGGSPGRNGPPRLRS